MLNLLGTMMGDEILSEVYGTIFKHGNNMPTNPEIRFDSEDGSLENPYVITSVIELQNMSSRVTTIV
ncbi:MAG: hypothetical protein R6U17_03555 [Thermoplasmata archaeon]